eukprot:9495129-Pyramimonas_sp.AAC.1
MEARRRRLCAALAQRRFLWPTCAADVFPAQCLQPIPTMVPRCPQGVLCWAGALEQTTSSPTPPPPTPQPQRAPPPSPLA